MLFRSTDLNLAEHGLRVVERPLSNFLPLPGGGALRVGPTLAATQAEVARFSRRDAERLPMGQRRAAEIDEHLVSLAREGKCVVRLFSGEGVGTEGLQAAGVMVELVPGVSVARRPADVVHGS